MKSQKQRKMADVEVRVIISPPPGEEPMRFRVAVHGWQLQDMRQNESYAAAVFEVFAIEVCERLKLDAQKCHVKVNLNEELFPRTDDDAFHTGDVLSESLFLH